MSHKLGKSRIEQAKDGMRRVGQKMEELGLEHDVTGIIAEPKEKTEKVKEESKGAA